MEECEGIGFVVVLDLVAFGTHGLDDVFLGGVAFVGGVLLDGADGDALVRHVVGLTPGSQGGHEPAVHVACGDRLSALLDLLERQPLDDGLTGVHAVKPPDELQVAHARAFDSAVDGEGLSAALDLDLARGRQASQGPPGDCCQVEAEDLLHVLSVSVTPNHDTVP